MVSDQDWYKGSTTYKLIDTVAECCLDMWKIESMNDLEQMFNDLLLMGWGEMSGSASGWVDERVAVG